MAKRPLVVFDFDGTLSPIAKHPKDAKVPEAGKRRLRKIALAADIIILTGRSSRFVRARLAGIRGMKIIGLHGNEGMQKTRLLSALEKEARKVAAKVPGVLVEKKPSGFTLHYRNAGIGEQEAEKMLSPLFLKAQGEAKVIKGRKCFEFLPKGASTKSTALARLSLENPQRRVVFIGDDESDLAAIENASALPNFTGAIVESEEIDAGRAKRVHREGIYAFVEKTIAWGKKDGKA